MRNHNEEQLRTPYHPTADDRIHMPHNCSTQGNVKLCLYIYIECGIMLILLSYCVFKNEQIHIEKLVYLLKAECSWFDAGIEFGRNDWLQERASFQFTICKNKEGYLKLNVGHLFDTSKLWIRKSKLISIFFLSWSQQFAVFFEKWV